MTDSLSNFSAYSSAGSFVVDTAVPGSTASASGTTDSQASGSSKNTFARESTSSSDGSSPSTSSSVVLLNDYADFISGSGQSMPLAPAQLVHFKVEGEAHTATVATVGDDYASLVLASTPQTVRLDVGQTGRYDVNGDSVADIAITLRGINNGVADLVFAATKQPAKITTQASTIVKKSRLTWLWFVASFIVITLAGLVLSSRRKQNT